MWPPSLRARMVAGFVGVAGVGTLLAALLTIWVVHGTFNDYLDRRVGEATQSAVRAAEAAYAAGGGSWTPTGLDRLAHELVLTGYDFRLRQGGRTLLDTTRPKARDIELARVARADVRGPNESRAATIEVFALPGGGGVPADAQFRAELDRVHLVAALIAGVLAIVLGLVLARRITRPLRRLAVAAR